jgi:exosortase J
MNASTSSESVSAKTSSSDAFSPPTVRTGHGFDPQKPADRFPFLWICLGLLVASGFLGLSLQFIPLWFIWMSDPLRSIGMLIVPAGLVLVSRVWWQRRWELRGTWWGLAPITLAFVPIVFSRDLMLSWVAGSLTIYFLPHTLPIYLYASGVILLFAGTRVWREAWFPLALLLLAQPVPAVAVHFLDLPLQSLSAHIARSFATLIGFPPTNPELLRLMFTPDFGMFIAPGCDGMRGAVTLGYVALIVGYLKRVSILRWFLYVAGAVLLGHLFNLIRLCTLVLYYRIAAGHAALEHYAKQADYVIGGCLFLIAAIVFLWATLRKGKKQDEMQDVSVPGAAAKARTRKQQNIYWKVASFAILVLIADVPGVRAIKNYQGSMVESVHNGNLTAKDLDDRIPKQIGDYKLIRAWQEQFNGDPVLENAVYAQPASNEITVGIWMSPREHSIHWSRMAHGESPEMRTDRSFVTAQGKLIPFDTAYYSDGVTDSLEGNTYCNPSFCRLSGESENGMHIGFRKVIDFNTRGVRFVPIFFRVEKLHADTGKSDINKELSAEAQSFLSGVDFLELSERFQ